MLNASFVVEMYLWTKWNSLKKINSQNKLNILKNNHLIQYLNIVTIVFGLIRNVQVTKVIQFIFNIYLTKWTSQNHCFQNAHQNKLKKFVSKWTNTLKVSNKKHHNSLIKSKIFLMNVKTSKIKLFNKDKLSRNHCLNKVKRKWKNLQKIL